MRALLLSQALPPWLTAVFPTRAYSRTSLGHWLPGNRTKRLGNTCAQSICVSLRALPSRFLLVCLAWAMPRALGPSGLATRLSVYLHRTAWCCLCGDTAVLVLHAGLVRGVVNCGCNPAFFLYEPASSPAHARRSINNKNRCAAYWWILKISGHPRKREKRVLVTLNQDGGGLGPSSALHPPARIRTPRAKQLPSSPQGKAFLGGKAFFWGRRLRSACAP